MVAGLTGGIGSGKSTVAEMFAILGCKVFNSDKAAKEIYFDRNIRPRILALLGENAYLSDKEINRNYISQKIFGDTQLLHQLNQIIHPAVGENFKNFVTKHPREIIIKETALLFEANLEKEVDRTIVVTASDELRIQRVMQRDGLSLEQVTNKMISQLSQEEKKKRADFVIDNNEQELLIPQVIAVFNELKAIHVP